VRASARSADELVVGVRVGGGVLEFHYLAVAETEDVRVVDLDAPAAPAGREDYQRDTALVVGEDRLKVKMEQPAADDDQTAPVTLSPPTRYPVCTRPILGC
jgi:hypothetical protein